jgi:hypothetical protein
MLYINIYSILHWITSMHFVYSWHIAHPFVIFTHMWIHGMYVLVCLTDWVDTCFRFLLPDACVCMRALQIISTLFVRRVLVSGRWLRLVSIVHHIPIVWSWLWVAPSFSVLVTIEWWTCQCVLQFAPKMIRVTEIRSRLCAEYRTVHSHAEAYTSG